MKRLTMDFETRSLCDLRKAGAYKYSLDPSTKPTCLAFKERGNPKVYLIKFEMINRQWQDLPESFRVLWLKYLDENFEFVAQNAFFEQCIYYNILVARYGWPMIPRRSWRCTAAKAAACALPRSLEGAGEAMNLTTQKDKMGYVVMLATCKPTKQWNAWNKAREKVASGARVAERTRKKAAQPEPPVFLEYEHNPAVWEGLYKYCKTDVVTEELLDDALPDLIPTEQEIWFLNQRLNWRGLKVDIDTVRKIVGIMSVESKIKLKELDTLTMGLVTKPGARQSILEFLALEGIELPDIRAKTVEDILKGGELSDDMRRLLEIRQQLSKTSTKKYQSFLDRAGSDGRVRDILLYHGASTGRDTGTGIQPHNFPRGAIKISKERPYATVENIIECDHETLKLLYGDSLAIVFSSILRNMIIPSDGCELYVADFSKIEVAVLWWLSDNWDGLAILAAGKDPYIYQASANLGKTYEEIERAEKANEQWALDARQLGKAQILGCGFRMSWSKFKNTAFDQYRLKLTNRQSFDAVKSYREANAPVVEIWNKYEEAAIEAVETGKTISVGRCKFFCSNGFLWIKLPSGRRLAYRSPSLTWRTITYDALVVDEKTGKESIVSKTSKPKKTLTFMGLDKSKKKLAPECTHGGVITENIVQAVARDLMMPGMVRLEKKEYTPLLMVHDEGICEKKKGTGSIDEFVKLLCQRPVWADEHLPLDAKGYVAMRYRK